MFAPLTGAIRLHKAGKLRILVMPSKKRNSALPNVPTTYELGYKAELDLFRALAVPKGTPAAVKAKLYDAMVKAANSKAFKDLGAKKGFTIDPMPIAQFDKIVAAEDERGSRHYEGRRALSIESPKVIVLGSKLGFRAVGFWRYGDGVSEYHCRYRADCVVCPLWVADSAIAGPVRCDAEYAGAFVLSLGHRCVRWQSFGFFFWCRGSGRLAAMIIRSRG